MNSDQNSEPGKEMSFWEHLEELRWRVMRSALAIVVFGIIAFMNRHIIFDVILMSPKEPDFITNRLLCKLGLLVNIDYFCVSELKLQIINLAMAGQFMMHFYISIVAGLILSIPYIIWEFWSFIKPALHKKEQKYARGAVFITSFLFLSGVVFSYFLLVPLSINFLGSYQISESVLNQISLSSYINTVISLVMAVGIVFEMPVLIYFLAKVGIVTPTFLRQYRRYIIVIILVIAAIITPPDVFSQIMVSVPLLGLYELSILVADRVYRKRQQVAGNE